MEACAGGVGKGGDETSQRLKGRLAHLKKSRRKESVNLIVPEIFEEVLVKMPRDDLFRVYFDVPLSVKTNQIHTSLYCAVFLLAQRAVAVLLCQPSLIKG